MHRWVIASCIIAQPKKKPKEKYDSCLFFNGLHRQSPSQQLMYIRRLRYVFKNKIALSGRFQIFTFFSRGVISFKRIFSRGGRLRCWNDCVTVRVGVLYNRKKTASLITDGLVVSPSNIASDYIKGIPPSWVLML